MRTYRPDDEHPQRTPDEILEWVYMRGHALRIRRLLARGAAAAAALTVVVATAVVAIGNPEPRSIRIVDSPSEPSLPPDTPTPTPTPSPSASPASPTPESSPTLVCHNSTNPACGKFYWDPTPGPNEELVIQVAIAPNDPKAGDVVVVTATAQDPDSPIVGIDIYFDALPPAPLIACTQERYGPWTPPDREAGSSTKTASHVFETGGQHLVYVTARSKGSSCNQSPYGSSYAVHRYIVVESTSSPTPSPSSAIPTP